VRNLRFTQGVLEALRNVVHIGNSLKLQGGAFGGKLVPALHVAQFRFTGVSERVEA